MTYVDRFGEKNECAIINLNVDGFDKLTLKEKTLVYFLSMAGIAGNAIYMQQVKAENMQILNLFHVIYQNMETNQHQLKEKFNSYFKEFLFHNGIHHDNSKKLLKFPFSQQEFYSLKELVSTELHSEVENVWFLISKENRVLSSTDTSIDLVKDTAVNYYADNLTEKEVTQYKKEYAKKHANPNGNPEFFINSKFVKNHNGEVTQLRLFSNGLCSKEINDVIYYLTKALDYTENKEQYDSIETLINFYKSGDPADFDKHSLAWIKDTQSNVFFINGFIETYLDPLGQVGAFESVVAFKNPEQTATVNKIINNIQWFEDNLPVDPMFKKKEAKGLSASSITVVSGGGESAPSLPLGICLPNSEWIRAKHGSKSVNLLNVHNARGNSEDDVKVEFFLPEYLDCIKKYSSESSSLHTDLHEIAGHGSGQTLPNVESKDLANYYSVIEETRADLVGLYYCYDKKLQDFGVINPEYNLKEFALAKYLSYFTNGLMLQLKRISKGDEIEQTHMRNRHLITSWILEHSKESNAVELINLNGKHYFKINDLDLCRQYLGELLGEIQRIKSTGDIKSAEKIILQYGTKFNVSLQKEVVDRLSHLDIPSFYGFIMPTLKPIYNDKNQIIDFSVSYDKSFIENRINQTLYYKKYI